MSGTRPMRWVAGALAILTMTAPAPAQTPGPQVVVTGRRLPDAEKVRQLTRAVTAVGESSALPLARFTHPLCPAAYGLEADMARRIERRLRETAVRAGVAVDRARCRPNLIIDLVPDGRAMVAEMRRTGSTMLGGLTSHQIERLSADPGPVHLWRTVELRGQDGDYLQTGHTGGSSEAPELRNRSVSILTSPYRRDIEQVIVLIDAKAALGKTLVQLADFTAMLALAETRTTGTRSGDGTILSLFARTDPPPELTAFDAAYLRSLYRGDAARPGFVTIRAMAEDIGRASPHPAEAMP